VIAPTIHSAVILAGNMLNDSFHSYVYDAEDEMIWVDGAIHYTNGPDGNRIRKDSGGSYTEYVGRKGDLDPCSQDFAVSEARQK
jgi:hypothetical protein